MYSFLQLKFKCGKKTLDYCVKVCKVSNYKITMAQLCLKWNNYESCMVDMFKQMLEDKEMLDVTIACEGESLDAHKLVLSACSDFFKKLFKNNPCRHPIVILKDVRFEDLQSLVHFMYHGSVTVLNEQLPSLLKTAETLQIKQLAEMTTRPAYELAQNMARTRNAKRKRHGRNRGRVAYSGSNIPTAGTSALNEETAGTDSESEQQMMDQTVDQKQHQMIAVAAENQGSGDQQIVYQEVMVDGMDPNAGNEASRILQLSMLDAEVIEGSVEGNNGEGGVEEMTGAEGMDESEDAGGEKGTESADESLSVEGSNLTLLSTLFAADSDNTLMLIRKKQSFVWEYFTETGKGSVKCKRCHKLLSYKDSSGSTSNMIKHLKTVHAVERAAKPPLQE